jgi:PAS domain S-box-containing protein
VRSESARAILEIAHSAFVTLTAEGLVVDWNPRAEELFGYSRAEAVGVELSELVVPARYREQHRSGLRSVASSREGRTLKRLLHLEALRRDGSEFPIDMTITAVRLDGEWLFHAWIQDVSERTELMRELEAQLRRGHPGFAEILDSLAEAVTIRDPHHHILYANRAALKRMGFASLEELQRRPPSSIFSDYVVHDEHGGELRMEDIPSVRLLAGQRAEALVLRTVNRSSGEVRWDLLKSAALHDDAGEPVAAVTIIEDITREKLAELRDRFLARATETLMSSLDYQETLRNVAWLAVPEIADWCAVDLLDERGLREQVVVAHRDPDKLALAEELRRFEAEEPDPDRGVGRVLRTGMSELYAEIPDELLGQVAVNDEHLRLLQAVGLRSVLLAPLRARGRTVGVMTLVTAESLRRFDATDKEFAEQVAARAAVAVDNARLATARREIAHTLQRSLLPDVVPAIEGWDTATMYRAAKAAEEVEVGGDFYDFFPTDGGWVVLLGDVTGKGVQAAAMTSLVRHGARFLSKQEQSPSRILASLHEALREEGRLSLCSALCLRLHPDCVVISSAGHPAPLVVRDDGRIREIGVMGSILGAWSESNWVDRRVPVADDETVFIYTDGVTDTLGERERFGAHRLRRWLSEHAGRPPGQLLGELEAALDRFQVDVQTDDLAAMALRPSPIESSTRVEPALNVPAVCTPRIA